MTRPPRPQGSVDTRVILEALESARQAADVAAVAASDTREIMSKRLDTVLDRMGRIERDIARGEGDRAHLSAEIGEVRRDLADTRDLFNLRADDIKTFQSSSVSVAAAQGGAQGTAQALSGQKGLIVGGAALSLVTFLMTFLAFGKAILAGFLSIFGLSDAAPPPD